MKIPRKIDDRLKDAIVHLQFETNVPGNTVAGLFLSLLKDQYIPVNFGPLNHVQIDQIVVQQQQTYFVHISEKFRVDINSNSITFNLVNGYAGWKEYSKIIQETLQPLFKEKIISKISRIGIRYISIFEHISIFDHILPKLSFAPIQEKSLRSQFKIELPSNDFLVILTLLNAFPKPTDQDSENIYSVIDIDTIKIFETLILTEKEFLTWLDKAHDEQKKMFFLLLKPEFLQTLNPEY